MAKDIRKFESLMEEEEHSKYKEYDLEDLSAKTDSECYKVVFFNAKADIVKELMNRKFRNQRKGVPI